MFNFKDYAFRIKCNNTPSMIIRVVAENYDEAIVFAKNMYAADNSIYADDCYNLWQIESL